MLKHTISSVLGIAIGLFAPVFNSGSEYGYTPYDGTTEAVESPIDQSRMVKIDSQDKLEYSATWDEHDCLSHMIYWEAKGESERGMQLVGQVAINRMNSDARYFPNTLCQVIKYKIGKGCAFEFYCDGRSDRPVEIKRFEKAKKIATRAMNGEFKHLTRALYFKKCSIVSRFFGKLKYLGREGNHCFYGEY